MKYNYTCGTDTALSSVDLKSVVDILQRRLFQTNSDASAYMHGSMELDERRLEEMGFEEVVGEAKKLVDELNADTDNSPVDTGKQPPLPDSDNKDKPKDEPKPKRNRIAENEGRAEGQEVWQDGDACCQLCA